MSREYQRNETMKNKLRPIMQKAIDNNVKAILSFHKWINCCEKRIYKDEFIEDRQNSPRPNLCKQVWPQTTLTYPRKCEISGTNLHLYRKSVADSLLLLQFSFYIHTCLNKLMRKAMNKFICNSKGKNSLSKRLVTTDFGKIGPKFRIF